MDQIEAERRRAKRSLVQWLYSDAHMKVPRRNYAELKKRYAKEDPKGKEPTPAQIRTRIREEWDIYHEELLSDRILQQEYRRLLGGASGVYPLFRWKHRTQPAALAVPEIAS